MDTWEGAQILREQYLSYTADCMLRYYITTCRLEPPTRPYSSASFNPNETQRHPCRRAAYAACIASCIASFGGDHQRLSCMYIGAEAGADARTRSKPSWAPSPVSRCGKETLITPPHLTLSRQPVWQELKSATLRNKNLCIFLMKPSNQQKHKQEATKT